MTAPIEATEAPIILRPLVCPYCGGRITVDLDWRGHGHLSEQVPDGFSCDDCGAGWEKDGTPACGPGEYYWRIGKPEDAVPPWLVTT